MKKEISSEKSERLIKKRLAFETSKAINSNTRMLNLLNMDFTDFVTIRRRGRKR